MQSTPALILRIRSPRRLALLLLLAVFLLAQRGMTSIRAWQIGAAVSTVPAASFEPLALAPGSIAASFGGQLATQTLVASDADQNQPGIQLPTQLAGTTVEVNGRRAGLFFVSPGQVNYVIPAATESGQANVVIRSGDGTASNGSMTIAQVSPGIFSANANGRGVPAATLLRVRANGTQVFEPVAQFNQSTNSFVARPIDLGPEGERVFLILFLTGIVNAQDANNDGNLSESIRVLLGGATLTPAFAGRQPDFVGLDQVNLELPRTLIGRGLVSLTVTAPGFGASNPVDIEIAGASGGTPPQIMGFSSPSALAGQELTINGGGFAPNAPDNIVRISGSNATVMSATPSQLRIVVPFGVQSGPVYIRTPQGESTSATALPIRTSISGLVENTARQPLTGVTVRITGSTLSTLTNSDGAFILPDAPPGVQFVEIDGRNIGTNPPYPRVTLKVTTQSNRDNQLTRPIALQQATGSGATIGTGSPAIAEDAQAGSADLQQQQSIVIKTGDFQLDVPGNSAATFPDGSLRGDIFLTPLLNGRTPVNLPFGFYSASVVQITPFNIRIATGAKLSFPNTEAIPAGTKVDIFRYDSAEGTFVREPLAAQVTPDGRRIETEPGTVKLTNFYFAAVQRPTTTVIGRVLEKDGQPVSRALVRFNGQEAFTDGTGSFMLRYVPVRNNDPVSVDVSFIRSLARIERVQGASAPAVVNGITNVPDVILPSEKDNRPPTILAPPQVAVNEGRSIDVPVLISDPDAGQTVDVTLSGASFVSLIKPASGIAYTLRIAPNFSQSGDQKLTITATDPAGGSSKQDLLISVADVNRAPTASGQSVTVDQNGSVTIRLEGNDPDGDPLTYRILTQPGRGELTGNAPAFVYRPNANYSGPDSFTYRVTDGALESDTATVTITVRSGNRPPVLTVPGLQNTTENKGIVFTVTATDPDPGQALSIATSALPAGASVVPATAPNSWLFRWTPNFTQAGNYTVSFTVSDNGSPQLRDTGNVSISVSDVPVLQVPGAQRVTQGSTLTFSVTSSSAATGIPLTISASNLPSGASIDTATGSTVRFRWPTTGNTPTGVYTVTFRAQHAGVPAINESRTVSITVDPIILLRPARR